MLRLLLFSLVFFGAHAQSPDPLQLVKAQGFKLRKVRNDQSILIENRGQKLEPGSMVFFVHANSVQPDPEARGVVRDTRGDLTRIDLIKESIIKFPNDGDYAVRIGQPWVPPPNNPEIVKRPNLNTEQAPPIDEPGYFEIDYGQNHGQLGSTSSNNANNAKTSNYSFAEVHFDWYFHFLSSFGLSYSSVKGGFPTSTYYHLQLTSSEEFSTFSINWRLQERAGQHVRYLFRLQQFEEDFSTSNTDENLLSSKYSGFGPGFLLGYDFNSVLYKPASGARLAVRPLTMWAEASYFPIVSGVDGVVSRGAGGSGSSALFYDVGFSAVLYQDYIPFFHWLVLTGKYGARDYKMSYSGPTTSEVGGYYTIPANGRYSETFNYWSISLGLRIPDYFGILFTPR